MFFRITKNDKIYSVKKRKNSKRSPNKKTFSSKTAARKFKGTYKRKKRR